MSLEKHVSYTDGNTFTLQSANKLHDTLQLETTISWWFMKLQDNSIYYLDNLFIIYIKTKMIVFSYNSIHKLTLSQKTIIYCIVYF